MDRSSLPPSAFIAPNSENHKDVELLVQQIITRLLNHLSHADAKPPLPSLTPFTSLTGLTGLTGLTDLSDLSDLSECLEIPENPIPTAQLFESLDSILASSMNAANPGYIGHMDSMPTLMSMLGDFVASAVNNNMLSVEMSPLFSQLETRLLQQFAHLFDLGPEAGGVLVSGGTLANLEAIAVARNIKFQTRENGIVGLTQQPVLFASEVAHTSIQKAAMILGLGTSAVIPVATNHNSQMVIAALEDAIAQAKSAHQAPFCIVATAGTTTTGNIDPIPEISRVAKAHDLWLHVDAAYGGAIAFSPDHRHQLAGIEQADSITFNPQKWLYVAKTCAMVLFKRLSDLKSAFQVQAPYMKQTDGLTNLGEISVQGTRHADVLKLWLSLQHLGQRSYAQLINESYALTQFVVDEIKRRPFLELASTPDMNIICFRGNPKQIAPEHRDSWNTDLQSTLLQDHDIFLSLPLYRGHRWLRMVLLNPYTERTHLSELFRAIDAFAERS
ncbi:MAG: aminotransferase class I/II-fold pyridoxal phosphate-dependent enzyme [Leptolyngbyaceae bacterium]|nr:aminotransferase class I/II-fold pyridoxal phosphate-dependent enzyme [Leptolyngbyaceae bacterium]